MGNTDMILSIYGKYESETALISAFSTQWSPREGVLIFSKVGN